VSSQLLCSTSARLLGVICGERGNYINVEGGQYVEYRVFVVHTQYLCRALIFPSFAQMNVPQPAPRVLIVLPTGTDAM
jgi:hypothetical protein